MVINFLANKFFDVENDDPSIRAQWIRYYIEVFVSGLSKTLEVFIMSSILGVLPLTFVAYLSFCVIRTAAFGWHALSSFYCSFQSILFFAIVPFLIEGIELSNFLKDILIVSFLIILLIYAPQYTEINDQLDKYENTQMKKIVIFRGIILSFILHFSSGNFALSVSIAMSIQILMLLPITKKIIQGKRFVL